MNDEEIIEKLTKQLIYSRVEIENSIHAADGGRTSNCFFFLGTISESIRGLLHDMVKSDEGFKNKLKGWTGELESERIKQLNEMKEAMIKSNPSPQSMPSPKILAPGYFG